MIEIIIDLNFGDNKNSHYDFAKWVHINFILVQITRAAFQNVGVYLSCHYFGFILVQINYAS